MSSRPGWLVQAITGDDNKTIDPSWLVVMWAVFVVLPGVIVLLTSLAIVDVYFNKHEASVGAMGGGIAAVIASVGAFIASCALILRQDRAPEAPSTKTTTTHETVEVTASAAGQPPPLAAAPLAEGTVERLAPKIRPEDVNKSVALVAPQAKKRGK